MEFRELSDFEWDVIRPFLPPRSSVGRPRADDSMSSPLAVGGWICP